VFPSNLGRVKGTRAKAVLPIGRTARIAFQIQAMRKDCCKAAAALARQERLDECELEECARLDDALAEAQRLLKSRVAEIVMARLTRRSRVKSHPPE
jgi:hypothetical protein